MPPLPSSISLPVFWMALASICAARTPDYEAEIKPLLKEYCGSCHSQLKQNGGLRLDAGTLIFQGGKHGAAVIAGQSDRSRIIERVTSTDTEQRMPQEGKPLAPEKIDLLRRWIDDGAAFPKGEIVARSPAEHWSFQALRRPPVPAVKDAAWVRNAIDAFVLSKWEALEMRPAPHAKPMALFRRLNLDLLGLPPELKAQENFAREPTDLSLDQRVDALLAQPGYGERWARHWLDVARYADSNGYERDAEKPMVWRYRDYVINALNADKPFDRFVTEQIAGDELENPTQESVIATGFLRLGHWDDEPADPATDRYDQLDDIVSTTGQAFLGLTIGCARCHDHKFEPLTSRDYYSLVAIFNPLQRPQNGRAELTMPAGDVQAYVWKESALKVPETHVLIRGSPTRPGDAVTPAVPAILTKRQPEFPPPSQQSTRRRLGLARWIASAGNPLTARVIVNRVWQQHFGRGIVATANDFGLMGSPPSDPELLDWLAWWFVHEAEWSLKKLHRLILTSNTWRQTIGGEQAVTQVHLRRLEAEALRDSVLSVSGQLDRKPFGPAMKPRVPDAALEANTDKASIWKVSPESETSRRTIYAFVKRGLVLPMLEVLDLADTVSSCPQRQVTTVAPQALSLFNGEFVNTQARYFARRIQREAGPDPIRQLRLAWQLALCRAPTEIEIAQMLRFEKEESLEQVCRVIFNLNEFAYPE
jgi:hypothetical protein